VTTAEDEIVATFMCYAHARQTYNGICAIGDLADEINKTTFENTFGVLQAELGDLMYVRVAALFEISKRSKTRSIPHLVQSLSAHAPLKYERSAHFLTAYGRDDISANCVSVWDRLCAFVDSEINQPAFISAFRILRTVRDKRIAHLEKVDVEESSTYEQVEVILEAARRSIQLAGSIYYNENIEPDRELIPGGDIHRNGLRRLIKAVTRPQ